VKSALTQLEQLNGRGEVLWIEIGGNDILESLPVSVYAERLEALLQSARNKYRTIVMMEIPAPPGGGGYGVTQRVLSKKYDIPLVPKRQFLAVLTSAGSTQDGVHLANAGHQRMAALVQKTLGWTNGQQPGEYQRIE
jgi:acyl-CoA thioesterase-1